MTRRSHFPTVGLDDVVNEIDYAKRRPFVVSTRRSKYDFIGCRFRKILRDQLALVQEAKESGTATREVMTVIVRLRGRVEGDKQHIEPWPEKWLKFDFCHGQNGSRRNGNLSSRTGSFSPSISPWSLTSELSTLNRGFSSVFRSSDIPHERSFRVTIRSDDVKYSFIINEIVGTAGTNPHLGEDLP